MTGQQVTSFVVNNSSAPTRPAYTSAIMSEDISILVSSGRFSVTGGLKYLLSGDYSFKVLRCHALPGTARLRP